MQLQLDQQLEGLLGQGLHKEAYRQTHRSACTYCCNSQQAIMSGTQAKAVACKDEERISKAPHVAAALGRHVLVHHLKEFISSYTAIHKCMLTTSKADSKAPMSQKRSRRLTSITTSTGVSSIHG